ncbi:MAG: geranylgeranylglyceryl/heptaprenylglyceryl phosphate synthase [Bacteroidales bacterium]
MSWEQILEAKGKKQFALLIDPDKHNDQSLAELLQLVNEHPVDYLLIGGSLVSGHPDRLIEFIKAGCDLPVFLFPGSLLQIAGNADAIFLLSLISGRNPEFLVGNHVVAAPFLRSSGLGILPVGYILVENGHTSSVEYMSNTKPLPADKPDIAVATAMAGEMLGMKLIYLEGGSGAEHPISSEIISQVKRNISIPLVVGGGIRTRDDAIAVYKAGADIIVVGNALENNMERIRELSKAKSAI